MPLCRVTATRACEGRRRQPASSRTTAMAVAPSATAAAAPLAPASRAPPIGAGDTRDVATTVPTPVREPIALGTHGAAAAAAATTVDDGGEAALRAWQHGISSGSLRAHLVVVYVGGLARMVCGVALLPLFDADHAYFALPMIVAAAAYSAVFLPEWTAPLPPEIFSRLAEFPAAARTIVAQNAADRRSRVLTLVHNALCIGLLAAFMASDLTGRGSPQPAADTATLRIVVVASYGLSQVLMMTSTTCCRFDRGICGLPQHMIPHETALKMLLAVTTAFADDVEAGLHVADVERQLLQLREVMQLLRGAALRTLGIWASFVMVAVTSVYVCLVEPEPPALYVYFSVGYAVITGVVPLTAARIHSQLARVPVALSVRACETGREAAVDGGGKGGDDLEAAATSAFEAATARTLARQHRELRCQAQSLRRQELDLLQARIVTMRLGWYVFGTPVSSALLARLRTLAAAIVGLLVRASLLRD